MDVELTVFAISFLRFWMEEWVRKRWLRELKIRRGKSVGDFEGRWRYGKTVWEKLGELFDQKFDCRKEFILLGFPTKKGARTRLIK